MGGNEVSSGLLSLKGENSPVGELTTMCQGPHPERLLAAPCLSAALVLSLSRCEL